MSTFVFLGLRNNRGKIFLVGFYFIFFFFDCFVKKFSQYLVCFFSFSFPMDLLNYIENLVIVNCAYFLNQSLLVL